ncbi:MAG: histidine phosphatase family protein [Spirochaetales bacterium]|nr:histidine phosphatase family protein [Spirochaetales bacterium]
MTIFIAVRHGETEWNKIGKQQGHLDSPLTPLGRKQAEALAAGLRAHRIDAFYASDLGRARETADVISRAIGLPYETDARLRERNLGIIQGFTSAEFAVHHAAELARFKGGDPDFRLSEGESERERFLRHTACLEDLAGRNPGRTVLIVTHGGALRSFMDRTLGIPLGAKRSYALPNAAINVFTIAAGNEWRLETWGGTAHLRRAGLQSLDDT